MSAIFLLPCKARLTPLGHILNVGKFRILNAVFMPIAYSVLFYVVVRMQNIKKVIWLAVYRIESYFPSSAVKQKALHSAYILLRTDTDLKT